MEGDAVENVKVIPDPSSILPDGMSKLSVQKFHRR